MKHYIFIVSILFFGCTPKEDISFNHNTKESSKLYYCAYVNYLELVLSHPIDSVSSIGNFEFMKESLNEIAPKGDANYYKVVSRDNKKIVYVYSMKTDKLKEMITLNEKDWIDSKKIFDGSSKQIRACKWSYLSEEGNMTITQKCDDQSKNIKSYGDSEDVELKFKNNKLVEKLVTKYPENTIYKYDGYGKLIDKFNTASESDMCIPFKPYGVIPLKKTQ